MTSKTQREKTKSINRARTEEVGKIIRGNGTLDSIDALPVKLLTEEVRLFENSPQNVMPEKMKRRYGTPLIPFE